MSHITFTEHQTGIYLIEEILSEKEHQPGMMIHNGILGTRQNKLFNYSNKHLFLRKTILENVFDYSVMVMII